MRVAITSAVAATLGIVPNVAADTAYIEPSTYAPTLDQTITIEASFNDDCCVPKYPVRSQAFAVILPNGTAETPDRIETFANSSVIEQKITQHGTTRITTGERLGRKGGEYVLLEGQYHLVNSEDAAPIYVPEGTRILTSQTATVSDTYVTVGAPSWESVRAPIGRLVVSPRQHPSRLSVGETFSVSLSFDGTALAGQELLLTRSGQKERPGDDGILLVSNAAGDVEIPLDHLGTHLIMTRLQAPAPDGAETDIRSYTTSLTFHVNPAATKRD
ncbi:MAG: DUF4198 domain-containing protein [Pseudomonadota bacterium]